MVFATLASSLAFAGLALMVRRDGYPERRFTSAPGRHWLIDEATGTLALADPLGGRVVVRLATERAGHRLDVAQASTGTTTGAYLIDHTVGQVMAIDEQNLRISEPRSVPELESPSIEWTYQVDESAIVAVPRYGGRGVVIPARGEPRPFDVLISSTSALITPGGGTWQVTTDHGRTDVVAPGGTHTTLDTSSVDAVMSALGDDIAVLERRSGELNWPATKSTVLLSSEIDAGRAVLQLPSSATGCIWIGAGDELICAGPDGVAERLRIGDGLQVQPTDRLAALARTAVIISDRGIVSRVDLRSGNSTRVAVGSRSPGESLDAGPTGPLEVYVAGPNIWVDDVGGRSATVLSDSGARSFDKLDPRAPLFGPTGLPLDVGGVGDSTRAAAQLTVAVGALPPVDAVVIGPDADGIAEAPIAIDDSITGRADTPLVINVTANDADADGDPIAISNVDPSTHGSLEIISPGAVRYQPQAGFTGMDVFTYTIADSTGKQTTARVTVELLAPSDANSPPVANADQRQTAAINPVLLDVLANDSDPDGDPLSVVAPTVDPSDGTVRIIQRSDGQDMLEFTPSSSAQGTTVTVTYRAADNAGGRSALTRVTLGVADRSTVNRPPTTVADAYRVRAGRTVNLAVLANDFDPDGDAVHLESAGTSIGTVTVVDGSVEFTAPADRRDRITFTYVATDAHGARNTGTVLVQVVGPDEPNVGPLARPDRQATAGGVVILDPVVNDLDPDGDVLSLLDVTAPAGLTMSRAGNTLTFIPGPGFRGGVATYTVSDGFGNTTTGTISITIDRNAPSAAAPAARDDEGYTSRNEPVILNVLANDDIPRNNPVRVLIRNCDGRCKVLPSNAVRYQPPTDRIGTFRFEYEVSTPAGSDRATARVTVVAPSGSTSRPDALIAVDDPAEVAAGQQVLIDVLSNDRDDSGQGLTIVGVGVGRGDQGAIDVTSNKQAIVYQAPDGFEGVVTFTYRVANGAGRTATATVTVRVVRPVGDEGPTAIADAVTLTAGQTADIDVAVNDRDPFAAGLHLDAITGVIGTVEAQATIQGRRIIVVPRSAQVGEVVVGYRISDGARRTAAGRLVVTYVAADLAPVAVGDAAITPAATPIAIYVLSNDRDPEGGPLTARLIAPPPGVEGRVDAVGSSSFRFSPAANFHGDSTFSYVAVDAQGHVSDPAIVTVTVTACVAGAPIATDRPAEFTPYLWPYSVNVLDPAQRGYTVSVDNVEGGTARLGPESGVVTFTPSAGNNGTGSFGFTVLNPCGDARSATVTIDVNRTPRVHDLVRSITRDRSLDIGINELAADDEDIRYTNVSATPGTATVTADGQGLRFSPPTGYVGGATVLVTVTDVGGLSATATVAIDISAPDNLAPVAIRDQVDARPGDRLVITPLDNDSDPDGPHDALTIELVDTDVHFGDIEPKLHLADDGRSVFIDIPASAHGHETFRYRAIDAFGARSETVKVSIVVNRPPNSVETSITLTRGDSTTLRPLIWKVMDDDGDPLEIISATGSDPGYRVALLDGATIGLSTTPDAPDEGTVTFVVVDIWGARSASTVTVISTG